MLALRASDIARVTEAEVAATLEVLRRHGVGAATAHGDGAMKCGYPRLAGLAAVLVLLNGCAVLREFRPAVEVAAMTPGEYIAL